MPKFKIHLLALIAIIYLFFSSGHPWIEADYQLQVSRSLIRNHSLAIDNPGYGLGVKGRDGRYYDPHGLANALIMTPVAIIELVANKVLDKDMGQFTAFLGNLTGIIVSSLACLVFFLILFLLERPLKVCFFTTLCAAFLTMIFPYATRNYEGNLNMLFILSSLYFLLKFTRENGVSPSFHFATESRPSSIASRLIRGTIVWRRDKISHLIYGGLFAGLAVATRDFSWLFLFWVIIFIFWFSFKKNDFRIVAVFISGLLTPLGLWGYYNWLRTGKFYLSVIAMLNLSNKFAQGAPVNNVLLGLKGLLLSQGASIFVYSPILVFSLFGWREFFQKRKKECIFILSIVLTFLLANAKIREWFGLWGWGPRYTLEITPLILLPLGFWLTTDRLKNKIKKYTFILICAYSLLIQLAATLTNWHARLGYLLARKGEDAFLFTARYSQWWDSIKTFLINLWNLMFGAFLYLENPGYDSRISDASLYTSKTLFTWWNRLLFLGVNPFWIGVYFAVTLVVIFYCFFYITKCDQY